MNKILLIILSNLIAMISRSQTLDSLVGSIERNNPLIQARENWLKAERVRSRSGIYPENPTLSYQNLWGNTESAGDQREFEAIQSFRLPMYYISKSAVQGIQYDQEVILAEKTKIEILHQARVEYFTLAWLARKDSLLTRKLSEFERLIAQLQAAYERKEITKTVLDKGRLLDVNSRNEWQMVQSEIQVHRENIRQLNGDEMPGITAYEYPLAWDLPDLDSLMKLMDTANPEILSARRDIEISDQQVKFERMNSLPRFEAGYKSQTILNQQLKGIHAGITIPLWENKNRIDAARLGTIWKNAYYNKVELEEKTRLKTLYLNAGALFENYSRMKEIVNETGIAESTFQLLQAGQISFTEYLVEVQLIYEFRENYLEYEREYYSALSELMTLFIPVN